MTFKESNLFSESDLWIIWGYQVKTFFVNITELVLFFCSFFIHKILFDYCQGYLST